MFAMSMLSEMFQSTEPTKPQAKPKKVFPPFQPKKDAVAEEAFQKALQSFKGDRTSAWGFLNRAVTFGTFRSAVFQKRAELLFLEKRFYECIRDVDVVLASPVPPESVNALLALKTKSLLTMGCPKMALSFLKVAKKCFKNADFSKKSELGTLEEFADHVEKKRTTVVDEASRLRSRFPNREEMLRRVKFWTPADGRKIGAATVSSALDLRAKEGDFVAARDIQAGMYRQVV
jgi:hypothetical protein